MGKPTQDSDFAFQGPTKRGLGASYGTRGNLQHTGMSVTSIAVLTFMDGLFRCEHLIGHHSVVQTESRDILVNHNTDPRPHKRTH